MTSGTGSPNNGGRGGRGAAGGSRRRGSTRGNNTTKNNSNKKGRGTGRGRPKSSEEGEGNNNNDIPRNEKAGGRGSGTDNKRHRRRPPNKNNNDNNNDGTENSSNHNGNAGFAKVEESDNHRVDNKPIIVNNFGQRKKRGEHYNSSSSDNDTATKNTNTIIIGGSNDNQQEKVKDLEDNTMEVGGTGGITEEGKDVARETGETSKTTTTTTTPATDLDARTESNDLRPTTLQSREGDDDEADDELEDRRRAEIEFVACAYSPEEAWCDVDNNIAAAAAVKDSIIKVHRRLSLTNNNNNNNNDQQQIVSLVLTLSMNKGYPATEPLEISFALEKGPTHLWNSASDAAPLLVESCKTVAIDMVGDEAIFAVFGHADEWVQDHWPDYCQRQQQQQRNHKGISTGRGRQQASKTGAIFLGRRLIYSHHIISKIKRGNMRDLGSHYKLTGFVKVGWPGIIIIEGEEQNCQSFYDDIKVWAWKYLVVRGEQQEKVGIGETIDSLRRFTNFTEVSEMSVVADHCREVGLEALFKTSMRVYDNNSSGPQQDMSSDGTPYGALVWVDHMNDGKSYRKWLRKTSADTNVFLMIKQCFPNHDFTKRPTILVAVVGEMEGVQDFMKRWRTSRVDVDSRGKACLERKMKVLHEGEMGNEVIDALEWDSASADSGLNLDREQLIGLIQNFGDAEWLASTVSLLSGA